MGIPCTCCICINKVGGIIPSTSEITSALSDQLGLFEDRLDGETIDPSDIESISPEDDGYYKTNTEYAGALEAFEDAMNGTD